MGYTIELNSVFKLPKNFDVDSIKEGNTMQVEKSGEHLYLLYNPIELCDSNYRYLGKIIVRRLTLEKNKTLADIEIIKLFSEEESRVFTQAFIKL